MYYLFFAGENETFHEPQFRLKLTYLKHLLKPFGILDKNITLMKM